MCVLHMHNEATTGRGADRVDRDSFHVPQQASMVPGGRVSCDQKYAPMMPASVNVTASSRVVLVMTFLNTLLTKSQKPP